MQTKGTDQIAEILLKQFKGISLSDEEQELLDGWLHRSAINRAALGRIQDEENIGKYLSVMLNDERTSDAFQRLKAKVLLDKSNNDKELAEPVSPGRNRIHRLTTTWRRYAAAVIIVITVAAYFLSNKGSREPALTKSQQLHPEANTGSNGAILTLSDGRQIVLDGRRNGMVASQNGTDVVLSNGALNYNNESTHKGFVYNTMSTPKARQFELVLSDGTHVWLNAASSIRYPSSFTGAERVVVITGEAYFEVKHDNAHPFKVIAGSQVIRDLGTAFNVKAYDDEPQIKTTLVEGSVQIGQILLNRPGQQLNGDKIKIVNTGIETAWKNGVFDFEGITSLREAMRQLGRWYDIDILYENGVPDSIPFTGRISRSTDLQSVLKLLENTSLKFRFENGKKLIIEKS
jgi:ferric-dicitrate binding protein FerR (iron transport regulator)